jgi:hypothetical protein
LQIQLHYIQKTYSKSRMVDPANKISVLPPDV